MAVGTIQKDIVPEMFGDVISGASLTKYLRNGTITVFFGGGNGNERAFAGFAYCTISNGDVFFFPFYQSNNSQISWQTATNSITFSSASTSAYTKVTGFTMEIQ